MDGLSLAYGYDELYRLAEVTSNVPTHDETFTYDPNGNRLTLNGSPTVWTYDHNEAPDGIGNNEIRGNEAFSYRHDANGNLVLKISQDGTTATRYVYNAEDRLIRVEDLDPLAADPLTDPAISVIATYGYDPFGRRLWKEVGGVRTYFAYAEEGLVGEYDATGTEIKTYGYEPDSLWTTNPLYQKVGGQYYWYLNDHAGTPQKLTDTAGRVVWSAVYEAFGRAQVLVADVENNLRLPGQYYDAETGLHYNWFRSYDPATGRYLRLDPLAEGLNHYAYALGNPIGLVDPEGLHVLQIGMGLAQIFAGFSATAATGGAGAVVGWIAVTNGLNNVIGGLGSLITGTPQQTPIQWGVQRLTGSQTAANWVQFGLNLVWPMKAPLTVGSTPTGSFRKGKTFFRSMSRSEAEAVRRTGKLRGGNPGETFFTDSRFRSGVKAKDRLSLPRQPEMQMEFRIRNNPTPIRNGTRVDPRYGGKGGGREFMTTDPVDVDIVNVQPY